MKTNLFQRLAPFLLFAVVFALFSPSVRYPLVNLDDHVYITQNRIVCQGLSPANVCAAFAPSNTTASMYMPLLWLSYMADVSLFGASTDNPLPFHAVNVVLHALSTVLLFLLLRHLLLLSAQTQSPCRLPTSDAPLPTPRSSFLPFLLALLWAVHPLRVESVAWVTERKDVLSAFFALLATLAYLKTWQHGHSGRNGSSGAPTPSTFHFSLFTFHCNKGYLCLALLAFFAGLLAKPSLVPLPLAWLAFDVWPLRRVPASPHTPGFLPAALRAAAGKLLFLPFAAAAAWGAVAQHHAVSGALAVPWRFRLAAVAPNFLFYLRKTFLPLRLSPLVPEQWVFPPATIVLALAVCAALAFCLWTFRRALPSLLPGAVWTLLFFLPASGLQPLPMNTVADRFFYLPSIGLSVALVALAPRLPRARAFLHGFLAVLLVLLSAVTFRILPTWSSTRALCQRAVAVFPGHVSATAELARIQIDSAGDFDSAEALLRSVLDRAPDVCAACFLYADCLLHRDSPDVALRFLLRTPDPGDLGNASARYSRLAHYAYFKGDFPAALDFAVRALPLYPDGSAARTALLFLCVAAAFDAGDPGQALAFARQTPALADLGTVSMEHLLPFAIFLWVDSYRDQAASLFFRILDACPDRADIANNILWGFATSGWSPVPPPVVLERARQMQAAFPVPDHPAILDTLAAAFANAGDFDAAVAAIDRALPQVPPSDPFRQSLLQRRSLYLSGQPCRDNGFERLFSASYGPPANAL